AEVEVRAAHGVQAGEEALVLVGPAGVGDDAIDRGGDLGLGLLGAHAATLQRARELALLALEHLAQAVEDLPSVEGGARRPAVPRGARGAHRVAPVLARGARDVLHRLRSG